MDALLGAIQATDGDGRVFILAGGIERVKQSEEPRKKEEKKKNTRKKETCLAKGEEECHPE